MAPPNRPANRTRWFGFQRKTEAVIVLFGARKKRVLHSVHSDCVALQRVNRSIMKNLTTRLSFTLFAEMQNLPSNKRRCEG